MHDRVQLDVEPLNIYRRDSALKLFVSGVNQLGEILAKSADLPDSIKKGIEYLTIANKGTFNASDKDVVYHMAHVISFYARQYDADVSTLTHEEKRNVEDNIDFLRMAQGNYETAALEPKAQRSK